MILEAVRFHDVFVFKEANPGIHSNVSTQLRVNKVFHTDRNLKLFYSFWNLKLRIVERNLCSQCRQFSPIGHFVMCNMTCFSMLYNGIAALKTTSDIFDFALPDA